ncbi:major outer membrane protein [Campylobacter mucosalis]|uniref:major outer membrane protein n=1 Tax=Campylobacter mucosalis TaxID=202 RepID=UPI0014700879|nr:major outer membrane protein [Campylobacter mucosalis]
MKLTKVSLAALVALGAFSSVASATPLEEAIKNVDVTGFARYRYDSKSKETKGNRGTDTTHNFRITTDFKAAFDDNFFGVLGLRYNSKDQSGNEFDKTDADGKFGVYQLYLGYKVGNTTITAGKQVLGTFFTDDEVGTGIKIVNQDITGLTLAALAVDSLDYDTYEVDSNLLKFANGKLVPNITYKPGNLYGVAAIGSYDPVAFQLWYASLEKVTDLLAVELSGNFAVTDDVAIKAKAQFVNSNADSKAKKDITGYNDGNFYAGQLGVDFFGANLTAGYVGWKVKDYGTTSFTLEDKGQLIEPGERIVDNFVNYTLIDGKGNFWFVKAGYKFDKFFVGADYAKGDVKVYGAKTKYDEYVGRLGYKYSKKLNFTTFYSHITEKDLGEKTKQDFYRFEAKYSF